VVAAASGPEEEGLVERAVQQTHQRTAGQPLAWCSDGWRPYPAVMHHVYRQPVRTGRPGRPALRLPAGVRLTQRIKHRDAHNRLRWIETRASLGEPVPQPALGYVERRHGVCRDRINAFTRKTHAFAKSADTWDALLTLHLFEHNWLRPHPALRLAVPVAAAAGAPAPRHFTPRTPAMALGLADHCWTWHAFLTTPVHVST
jgi:IS1 family transposase